jgi:quercetin dioxygenase-like cupin family protein
MKRFLLGLLMGLSVAAVTLLAQKMASDKVVEPQPVLDNQKVKVVRWVLKPGEGTSLHNHTLDHVAVILQGSTMMDMETDGREKSVEEKTGEVVFVPGTGRTHSFANAGSSTLEIVSIELK